MGSLSTPLEKLGFLLWTSGPAHPRPPCRIPEADRKCLLSSRKLRSSRPVRCSLEALSQGESDDALVLGLGSIGLDMVGQVNVFPEPDAKIRTTSFEIFGGGNCGNTLTAISRLGYARTSIISKIGDDKNGQSITSELEADHVSTAEILVESGMNSPLTYVIVDKSGSRTCIHTPAKHDVCPSDLKEQSLENCDLLHLDSRHTAAAIELAKWANNRNIPVSIDVEKDRPGIRELLPLADYIFTNSTYPEVFSPTSLTLENAMSTLLECGRASFVTTTLGAEGSMMMRRTNPNDLGRAESVKGCPLMITRTSYPTASECRSDCEVKYDLLLCPAWPVAPDQVVDSTGAGDAFIGGVLTGILRKMSPERSLLIGTRVAAKSIQRMGARTGLPHRHEVESYLLE